MSFFWFCFVLLCFFCFFLFLFNFMTLHYTLSKEQIKFCSALNPYSFTKSPALVVGQVFLGDAAKLMFYLLPLCEPTE